MKNCISLAYHVLQQHLFSLFSVGCHWKAETSWGKKLCRVSCLVWEMLWPRRSGGLYVQDHVCHSCDISLWPWMGNAKRWLATARTPEHSALPEKLGAAFPFFFVAYAASSPRPL